MNSYLVVFVGAGLGGMARHGFNVFVPRWIGATFPYHTLIVNVLGSLVMGLLAGYFALKGEASQSWRLFLMTGILGGFTTFSAFSLDASLLYERGDLTSAAMYVITSVGISIVALFGGLYLMRTLS